MLEIDEYTRRRNIGDMYYECFIYTHHKNIDCATKVSILGLIYSFFVSDDPLALGS